MQQLSRGQASIIIPVLNEKENLKELLPRLFSFDCEVIVADNGSTDGTVRLVEDAVSSFNIRLSKGTGTVTDAILRGIKLVSYDKIIVMDGDGSHDFQIIGRMVSALDEHDMVVGSRYASGGGSKDSLKNRIISRGFNLLTLLLAPGVKDRASGFFGIRKSLTNTKIRNTVKPMLEYLVKGKPSSVVEVPYTFRKRELGSSKLGRTSSIPKAFLDLIHLYLAKYHKFVKFCLVGGCGAIIHLGIVALFTEVFGLWYMLSVVFGIGIATMWNFTGNFLWTFGSSGSLLDIYNLGHKIDDGDFEWWEWYGPHPLKRLWRRKMARIILEFAGKPRSVLNLGCGSTPVSNMFRSKLVGVDINEDKVNFIRNHSRHEFLVGDIRTFKSDEEFDCILCSEILEHMDPSELESTVGLVCSMSSDKVIVAAPDYSYSIGKFIENIFHKYHYDFRFDVLDKIFLKFGFSRTRTGRWLWDTVALYRKEVG